MPSVCIFDLNKTTPIYFSGETITGTITLQTTSEKNVRDVCIIFLGVGKVKWDESSSTTDSNGSSSTSTTYYRSLETYIDSTTCVYGGGVLPAGSHTYTFNIRLPWECPTSCEGLYGHIRYEISLKINRYYRCDNVYKRPVTVVQTIDLNLNPIYKIPLELEANSRIGCWPCSKGKILCTLNIPFAAYAPGQMVNFALHIVNQSMSDCEGYRIEFIQKIIFTAKSPNRKKRHSQSYLVSKSVPDKCLRLTNRILRGEFRIPATPSTTEISSIICVAYTLKITIQVSSCCSDLELKIPIIIGTIPIRESLAENQLFSNDEQKQQVLVSDAEGQATGSNLPPSYNEIKPPTFEEATSASAPFVDTDVDEKNRIVGFRPLYPIYNMPYNTQTNRHYDYKI